MANLSPDDKQSGVYHKYNVTRVDGSSRPGGKHEHCTYFVLDMNHDPHAVPALRAYALSCQKTHPKLAEDLWKITKAHKPNDAMKRCLFGRLKFRTRLYTKDGRVIGNAKIMSMRYDEELGWLYSIKTEYGNYAHLTLDEILEYYYDPRFEEGKLRRGSNA